MDDPVEASFEAWPRESAHLGERLSNLALSFAGIKFVYPKLLQIFRDQFFSGSRFERIEYLFTGIRLGFQRMQSEHGEVGEWVKAINARLEGEPFREAVAVACEEAVRTVGNRKIEQMAAVLVGSLDPTATTWASTDDDIATMIRDLAQLGDRDVQVLGILATVHASAISHMPGLQDPHQFSKEAPALKAAIASSGIHHDDFLSTCERLRGFGLGAEVLRNNSHMGPEDFCYRPTRRGLLLLDYLKKRAVKVAQK
jgi:hypothetical protein